MASTTHTLMISSSLQAPPELVWAHITSKSGINQELWPFHMSGPERLAHEDIKLGEPLFLSLVSLLRVIPLDLHELTLQSLDAGEGYHEASRSLLEKRWVHKRSVRFFEGGSIVVDDLEFQPRFFSNVVSRVVRSVFERRHTVLRRKFGKLALEP